MAISMTRDQYDALLDYAFQRRTDLEVLTDMQSKIDEANGIRWYFLYIRWMETGGTPPTRIQIGLGWPPTQNYELRLERPITPEDVQDVLNKQARTPVAVTVTNDENGVVGWTELDLWDFDTAT